MKKLIALILTTLILASCIGACVKKEENLPTVDLQYIDVSLDDLNEEAQAEVDALFYQNDYSTLAADPACVYCEEDGYYYMYGTYDTPMSGQYSNHAGIRCFRSKTLTDWEPTGFASFEISNQTVGFAFLQPVAGVLDYSHVSDYMSQSDFEDYIANSWIKHGNIWAPCVMYEPTSGLYYMYSSAQTTAEKDSDDDSGNHALFLAISEHPAGPFIQWTGINASGKQIDYATPLMEFKNATDTLGNEYEDIDAIDAQPFIDPISQDKYLFFVGDRGGDMLTNNIFGLKMTDWFTPNYATLTLLAKPNFQNVTDKVTKFVDEGDINEGPYVIYNEETNKYYLTYSANEYTSKSYMVKQAIADNVLGPYTKLEPEKGGRALNCDEKWIHRAGSGHHTFIEIGGETYFLYHMHKDPNKINYKWKQRVIAIDKMTWVENQDGLLVIGSNGPSYDLRLRPEALTGYTNIADKAKVSCNQQKSDTDVKYLTDGAIKMDARDGIKEFEAKANQLVVTMSFSNPITLKGLMVSNSWSEKTAFEKIEKIEVEYKQDDTMYRGVTGEVVFDWDKFCYGNYESESDQYQYISGCSATALFEDIQNVYKIKIYLKNQNNRTTQGLSVSEITVIGKS